MHSNVMHIYIYIAYLSIIPKLKLRRKKKELLFFKHLIFNTKMSVFSSLLANSSILLKKSVELQQIRGSHGRTMFIRPGKFYTKKYFDLMVFF